jgi:hypothetical protein
MPWCAEQVYAGTCAVLNDEDVEKTIVSQINSGPSSTCWKENRSIVGVNNYLNIH